MPLGGIVRPPEVGSGGNDIQTRYGPGDINVQTRAPGAQLGAGNQMLALLGPLLDWKMAMAERQMAPPVGGAGLTRTPPMPGPREGSRMPNRVGPNAGAPMFTKMVGGPQMVAGRVAAQPWEAGAAFSGYGPPGFSSMPNNATFAGPQGGDLTGPGISRGPAASQQAAMLDPFPHGTGQAFAQQQMAAAKQRSDREIDEREERRRAGSRE